MKKKVKKKTTAKKLSLADRLKQKAKDIEKRKEERASQNFTSMFKPRVGEQFIRILPRWSKSDEELGENEFFFVEKIIHYIPKMKDDGSGTVNIPVPCMTEELGEEECPICNAVAALKEEAGDLKAAGRKTEADKVTTKMRKIRQQRKALYNIMDYGVKGEIDPNVIVWACPETVHEDIMAWSADLGTFWSTDDGRDWRLKKIVDKKKGPIGTRYKVYPSMKNSAIPEKLADELDNMEDLDAMWSEDPTAEMEAALKLLGFDVEEGGEETEEEPEPPRKTKAKKTTKKATRKGATAKPKPEPETEVDEEDGVEVEIEEDESLEDLGIDTGGDDDLEAELKELGVR